jgi:signal transduction histidine kinase
LGEPVCPVQAARDALADVTAARLQPRPQLVPAIEVEDLLADVPVVRATRSGLREVLGQLLTNAMDAMPHGGRLILRSRAEGQAVRIEVQDTGVGMEDEVRRRVFEPFFTTKATVDAGLGLALAHGVVTSWGGRIEVASMPGVGSVFAVVLQPWTPTPVQ